MDPFRHVNIFINVKKIPRHIFQPSFYDVRIRPIVKKKKVSVEFASIVFQITTPDIARHRQEFYQVSLTVNVYTKAPTRFAETFTIADRRRAELEP